MNFKKFLTKLKKQKVKTSIAVLFTDGEKFLVVHPTGFPGNIWELPKGLSDPNESPVETAVREFQEECGLKLNPSNLKYTITFQLHMFKNIKLYLYRVKELPPTNQMHCMSTFKPDKLDQVTKTLPEVNGWQYITVNQLSKYVRQGMQLPIKTIMRTMEKSL